MISGLPGVGKTAVAAGVAARLHAVHLSVDAAEDAMLGAGLPSDWQTGVAAYEATRAAAEQNLALGWDVVIDAVNDSEPARWTWRHAAERTAAALRLVVLACSHQKEHRRRLESRQRGFRHLAEPAWAEVEARARAYQPWTDRHVLIDTYAPLETVIETTCRRLAEIR